MPALNIKNDRAHQLAQELTKLTGESQTEAVIVALEERLKRVKKEKSREGLAEKLMAIGRETSQYFPKEFRSTDIGDLLFDEYGLPK